MALTLKQPRPCPPTASMEGSSANLLQKLKVTLYSKHDLVVLLQPRDGVWEEDAVPGHAGSTGHLPLASACLCSSYGVQSYRVTHFALGLPVGQGGGQGVAGLDVEQGHQL